MCLRNVCVHLLSCTYIKYNRSVQRVSMSAMGYLCECAVPVRPNAEIGAHVQVGAAISIPSQHPKVRQHKDSVQFNLVGYSWEQVLTYLDDVKKRGVPVAVFGTPGGGLARDFRSWRYLYRDGVPPAMEKTVNVIEYCVDLRLPPRFTLEDFEVVSDCLLEGFKATGPPAALSQ